MGGLARHSSMPRALTPVKLTQSDDQLRSAFKALQTRGDVASLLEIGDSELVYLLYRKGSKYIEFDVPKRSGGTRHIAAPDSSIKILQRRLNQVLLAVYVPKAPVHGFARGRSIVTNAKGHLRKRLVLNLDLEDFFPSIHFGRVRGVFAAPPYNVPLPAAQVMAQICCHRTTLPQGAPTSPVISNMVCAALDGALRRLAEECRCTYTRYADDITFSTTRRSFSEKIATVTTGPDGKRNVRIGDELRQAIDSNSFRINLGKVRLRNFGERQEVTGLVVHTAVNVPREFVKNVRGMLHAWEKFGYAAAENELRKRHDRKHRRPGSPPVKLFDVVAGKLEFIRMVKSIVDPVYTRLWNRFVKLVGGTYQGRVGVVRSRDQIEAALWILESGQCCGTAFFLQDWGLVTCEHNLGHGTVEAYLASAPSDRLVVLVTHRCPDRDLARLEIDRTPTAMLRGGDSAVVRAGDAVTVAGFGNYAPGGTSRLISGNITGAGNRHGFPVFYTDHHAFAGNSGGPVLNALNEVIGILQRAVTPGDPATHAQETTVIPVSLLRDVPAVT